MANTKQQDENNLPAGRQVPKRPSLNFGKKPSAFAGSGNRGLTPKSFIPPPVRVTQNKGSGGK